MLIFATQVLIVLFTFKFLLHVSISITYNVTPFCLAHVQVEYHPYLNQRKLLDFSKSKDIFLVAFGALGTQRYKQW
jgi:diketogulonate reductase-like aldo/keto reductase